MEFGSFVRQCCYHFSSSSSSSSSSSFSSSSSSSSSSFQMCRLLLFLFMTSPRFCPLPPRGRRKGERERDLMAARQFDRSSGMEKGESERERERDGRLFISYTSISPLGQQENNRQTSLIINHRRGMVFGSGVQTFLLDDLCCCISRFFFL